jgi:hypothetical protein
VRRYVFKSLVALTSASPVNTAAMAIANNVPFPKLPDVNTFLINNYTLAPVFFGKLTPITGFIQ